MKNKSLGVFLWLIGLVATHLALFLLSPEMTAARWVTYGFTLFAFLSQLILWLAVWKKQPSNTEQFYSTPMLLYSTLYLLGEFIVCIVFSLAPATVKIAVLVNALVALIMLALLSVSMIGRNHAARVDARQKNHHRPL